MESERHGLGLAVGLLHGKDVVLRGGDRPDDGLPVPQYHLEEGPGVYTVHFNHPPPSGYLKP